MERHAWIASIAWWAAWALCVTVLACTLTWLLPRVLERVGCG